MYFPALYYTMKNMTATVVYNLLEDTNHMGKLVAAYQRSKKRLLLFDYDGTLRPIAPTPDQAKPSAALLRLLQGLADDPRNTLVIISGRDQATLDTWLGKIAAAFVAEHGAFSKHVAGEWQALTADAAAWKQDVRPLLEASARKTDKSFVEEKRTALVWHHRLSDPAHAAAEDTRVLAALKPLARKHGLAIVHSGKNVEVKGGGADKGKAAAAWLSQSWDFMLAAGDEPTDEDLFRAMPAAAYTVKIGAGDTAARFRLPTPATFVALLDALENASSAAPKT